MSDRWPSIRVNRFDFETRDDFARRRAAVTFIVDGFRHSRFSDDLADRMDELLDRLLSHAAELGHESISESDIQEVERYSRAPLVACGGGALASRFGELASPRRPLPAALVPELA